MLQGICEFNVETEYLDTPSDVFGYGVSPQSINLTWSTDAIYWQPSHYKIKFCHKESLSKAGLPLTIEKCGQVNISANSKTRRQFVIIEDLHPFSEYEFQVIGKLDGFTKETMTMANARTS